MLYKTEGIIIGRRNLGDYDRLFTVYTKNFGKILIKGKSVRKNQSKLRGHLELFLRSHLMIAPGRGFDIIT
ncbi:MAG: recombination protein O N-terminal domain-containing protein, partial [Patescibacteria group bacterium]|nr:recombination protein O N-terminal domain-containing protein [Patescibacteria group bacterium]